MKNLLKWLVLASVLLWLAGCTHTSEAKVTVVNTGSVYTYVSIYYASSKIAVGKSDTFTLSWPGRDVIDLIMQYYPVGQPLRVEFHSLSLKDGDDITVEVKFSAE